MTLTSGNHLGPFEIVAPLGADGMAGERSRSFSPESSMVQVKAERPFKELRFLISRVGSDRIVIGTDLFETSASVTTRLWLVQVDLASRIEEVQ